MKIDLTKLSNQEVTSTSGAKKMKLSENASSMVFQLFTKNVYSNPIGTVVREITSNCFDSHVEAGVDDPVVIKRSRDPETGTRYISFIDFGVGMSPQRVEEIYMVYFESTKRVDNTQIGGFGIGGKTPLAYRRSTGEGEAEYDNSFYVITNFDGIKYYYCIFQGENSPEVSLLHSEETTERNGTEIRIPVLEKDEETFEREMRKQLYYFENIVFEGFEEKDAEGNITRHTQVENDYQIIRGKTFLYRGDNYSSAIHVCLGRVAYPIDYSALGLYEGDYRLPVAIKLEVGDVGVTVSREQLDYSESTIKTLKAKLVEVQEELTEMLRKQYENVQTLQQYYDAKLNFGHLAFPNGTSIHIGNVIKKTDIDYSNFKYQWMSSKFPEDSQLFNLLFDARRFGKPEPKGYYSNSSFTKNIKGIRSAKHLYYVEGEFNRKMVKQGWLKYNHERYYIIVKNDVMEIGLATLCSMFNTDLTDTVTAKGEPTKFMKALMEIQEDFMEIIRDNAEDYDTLDIPEEFIESRKRERLGADVLQSTIPVRFHSRYYRSSYRVKIQHLVNLKNKVFYGFKEDEEKLSRAYTIYNLLFDKPNSIESYSEYSDNGFGKAKGICFIQIAKGNEKYMKFMKNAVHVDEIYWKLFHRKAEYVREYMNTYKIMDSFNEIEELYLEEQFAKISSRWSNKVQAVKKYIDALPEKSTNLDREKWALQKYFNLDDIELTPEQQKWEKEIQDILAFQSKNAKTLEYISLPYRYDREMNPELVKILAKVMSF